MRGRHRLTGLVLVVVWALLVYQALAQKEIFEHPKILKNGEAQPAQLKNRNAPGGYDVPTDYGSPPPDYSLPPPYYPPPEPTEISTETSSTLTESKESNESSTVLPEGSSDVASSDFSSTLWKLKLDIYG
ncbi:hypothetical protein CC79DRAFT_1320642 [Sarocladium strictum]